MCDNIYCKTGEVAYERGLCKTCFDGLKWCTCRICEVRFEVLPGLHDYDLYDKESYHVVGCHSCLDKCHCQFCDYKGDDLLLCDECGLAGATCLPCAQLDSIPEGDWSCCSCVVVKRTTTKKIDCIPIRKRSREDDVRLQIGLLAEDALKFAKTLDEQMRSPDLESALKQCIAAREQFSDDWKRNSGELQLISLKMMNE